MSLTKIKAWTETHGRKDVTEGRSAREQDFLSRVWGIAMDLDGVVANQGAKVGKGGEHLDLQFGRMFPNRKTAEMFCGVLLRPTDGEWQRKGSAPETDTVRLYIRLSEIGCARSDWSAMVHENDAVKADEGWRYFELPERIDIDGDELLDLIEDAYFEIAGI